MSQLCPNIDSNICRSCEFRETCNVNAANQTATWGSINGDIKRQQDLQGVLNVLRSYIDSAVRTLREELLGRATFDANELRAEFRNLLGENSVSVGERFAALESGLQKQIVDLRDVDIAGLRNMVIPVRDGFVTLNKDIDTMLDNRVSIAKGSLAAELETRFDGNISALRDKIDSASTDIKTLADGFDGKVATLSATVNTTKSSLDTVTSRVGTLENAGYQTAAQVQNAMSAKLADYALNSTVASMQNKIDSAVIAIHRGIWSADGMEYKAGNTVTYGMYPIGSMLPETHIYRCIAAHTSSWGDLKDFGTGRYMERTLDPDKWENCGVYIETAEA